MILGLQLTQKRKKWRASSYFLSTLNVGQPAGKNS
jgi:hypothetical protein